jgi:hypothetical protein
MITLIIVWFIVTDIITTYSQCKFNSRVAKDVQALKNAIEEAK